MCFQVRQLQGDPLALSYWLASNLPLEDDTRQRLLEAPTVVERSVYGLCSALHFWYCTTLQLVACVHCAFHITVHNPATSMLQYISLQLLYCNTLHLPHCNAFHWLFHDLIRYAAPSVSLPTASAAIQL